MSDPVFEAAKARLMAQAVDKDPVLEAQAAKAARFEAAAAAWRGITPPAFWGPDDERNPLHSAISENWRKIAGGKLFLVLLGDSRVGKSWCCYKALRRDCMAERKVIARRCAELSAELSALFRDEPRKCLSQMAQLKHADVLFLDDIDKAVFTERFAEQLFEIIDYRTDNLKHTLITANTSAEMLAELLTKNGLRYAGPLVNRLQEKGTLVISRFVAEQVDAQVVPAALK